MGKATSANQNAIPQVICLGEALIDMVSTVSGVSLMEAPAFKKAAGGAPANVAVGLARLGVKAGFISKVGDDDFGRFLTRVLRDNSVDTSQMRFEKAARTALAFVSLKDDGERDFMFYRHPSADMLLRPEEISPDYIAQARVFHYGSISLIGEPSRSATLRAVDLARTHGLLISCDPNLRLPLWNDAQQALDGMKTAIGLADLVKVSEEELAFVTGLDGVEEGSQKLLADGVQLVAVSLGARGCYYATHKARNYVRGWPVEAVDTTGAGDGFVAGMLAGLLDALSCGQDLDDLSAVQLEGIFAFANAAGALTTLKRGAIPALPTRSQVERFLQEVQRV